jgi:hypothetical protein
MKKILFVLFAILTFANFCHAQYQVKLEKWKLKYETPEKLEEYATESENVNGRDNDNYAVDIEMVQLNEESDEFIADVKYAAYELAKDLNFIEIGQGDSVPKIKRAYYVIGKDHDVDGSIYPAVIMVVINDAVGLAFEITIYCYNKNTAKGIAVAKSFEILN